MTEPLTPIPLEPPAELPIMWREDGRFTLAEARVIIREEIRVERCLRRGHDLRSLGQNAQGREVLECTACVKRFREVEAN